MKIVVTGASGFLGSNLVAKLEETGHNVLSISRNTPNPLEAIVNYEPNVVVHCAWKGGNNYKDIYPFGNIDPEPITYTFNRDGDFEYVTLMFYTDTNDCNLYWGEPYKW